MTKMRFKQNYAFVVNNESIIILNLINCKYYSRYWTLKNRKK